MILTILNQEFKLSSKHLSDKFTILSFYIIAVMLFIFAIGVESKIINSTASGIIWLCFLFSSTIAAPNILQHDYEDGSLDQLLLRNSSANSLVFAKFLSYYFFNIFPLIIISPLIAIFLNIQLCAIFAIITTLLIGGAIIAAINIFAACLTLNNSKKSALFLIIALPFTIPTIILSIIAANSVLLENDWGIFLSYSGLLASLCLILLPIFLLASSNVLKLMVKN
jgi:heme exporter protein B